MLNNFINSCTHARARARMYAQIKYISNMYFYYIILCVYVCTYINIYTRARVCICVYVCVRTAKCDKSI